ncbi:hypothetical protein CICLE_v10003785mg [Citrus x clementina]|uniref:Uncharacterized protein n=1 Tax=Citrus clementina TaxID=85681 RepID=V4SY75_CITCL|nr:hypothetical protein CICLE_v10003785mg [Citrus x clementina]
MLSHSLPHALPHQSTNLTTLRSSLPFSLSATSLHPPSIASLTAPHSLGCLKEKDQMLVMSSLVQKNISQKELRQVLLGAIPEAKGNEIQYIISRTTKPKK